jgi:hypothetical protein
MIGSTAAINAAASVAEILPASRSWMMRVRKSVSFAAASRGFPSSIFVRAADSLPCSVPRSFSAFCPVMTRVATAPCRSAMP